MTLCVFQLWSMKIISKEEMKSFENAFNLVDVMRSIDNWIYAPTNRYYTNLRRIDRVYITSNMRSKVIGYGQTNKTQITHMPNCIWKFC